TSIKVSWSTGSQTNQTTITTVGVYYVTATKSGCITTATINVVNKEFSSSLIIPNIFTPNGDGTNDVFEFNTSDILIKEFKLYNRWGKLIYTVINAPVKWDGKQNNDLVDDGTYYWVALFNTSCNSTSTDIKQKGFLTVLK